ncbi:helix-turn-helix domain-containing protein [Paenibacillus wynnii]|nr:helix-turn-helix transcriptional regulator [Paenibacillus wynnii]
MQLLQIETVVPALSGKRIRHGRKLKDMTIVEVAAQIGISAVALSYIEGNKNIPSLPTLKSLSDVLDLPIYYLGCFEDLPEVSLGEQIRKARMYRGMLVLDMSVEFCVDVKTIRNWETDKRKPLSRHMKELNLFLEILAINRQDTP